VASRALSIAHVCPLPWEAADSDLVVHVRELCEELSRRGHRVLVLAPSRSGERVRENRRALRQTRAEPGQLLEGTDAGRPRVLAVAEALALRGSGDTRLRRPAAAVPVDASHTLELLLSSVPLDFVHVHEPFARSVSNAALRHSRSLNVATFHAPTERLLSTAIARRLVEGFFGRLDARTATSAQTAALMSRHFGGEYTLLAAAERRDWAALADQVEAVYEQVAARRHDRGADAALTAKLAGRPPIDVDLHMHTDHSHDCETPVEVLLATARERGLRAIAVTDHNEISGALEAREKALRSDLRSPSEPPLKVIVGEEVKTASEGEVIGLFIERRIAPGMTLAQTIAEIRRQGGLVYVPHPFDRMHSVPDYEHLLPVLPEIDAIEVFNPRVAIAAFNEEAARFAGKYRIATGAGSDSHVAQGLGSVRIRMRDFEGPAEFLQSLREADILTKPKSLLYVQALKFLQTKAAPQAARRASRERRVRRATQPRRRA
jgi:predicted metal-dependent phosphoesterase TrpH